MSEELLSNDRRVQKYLDLFRLSPPQNVMRPPPQLQSTCHYIVNHCVKIRNLRLEGAKNMRPLSWGGGGGGTNLKDPNIWWTRTMHLPLYNHVHYRLCYLAVIYLSCNHLYISNKGESNSDHSKMKNEGVKKSLEKSKNVLEEKRKMSSEKFGYKHQHVYNNCFEVRSRAINSTIHYYSTTDNEIS